MPVRKSRQIEVRMVAEYLKENYSKYSFITKQPLGKVPEELMTTEGYKRAIGMWRPYRPEVDAVVIMPGALILIEAKVKSVIDGCAKLPLYKSLIPFTPELKAYWKLPIEMELVVAETNPNLEIMARDTGVRLKVYCPDWLQEIINSWNLYWTAEYRHQREEKIKLREYYGIE